MVRTGGGPECACPGAGRLIRRLALAVFIAAPWGAAPAAGQSVVEAGDALQILIPSAAFASTLVVDDMQGTGQFFLSFGATVAATHFLKWVVDKERPHGGGSDAFPSGHTSAAFQGAAFIHFRYGFKYAVPAYVGATYVAYSRVYGDKHYVEDVIAGAALAIGLTALTTTRYVPATVAPLTTADGGVGLTVQLAVR